MIPPGYTRGYIVGPPGKGNYVVVTTAGRYVQVAKEQLRDVFGTELWTPSPEDIDNVRKAQHQLQQGRVECEDATGKEKIPENTRMIRV